MTEIADTLDTSQDVVPDPTASEVHPRLAQRSLTPGALNGTIQVGPPGQNGTDGADGIGVPPGGTEGQVLAKADDDDYDTEWVDAPTGGGGGSVGQEGPPITGSVTVSPNTFYLINLAADLGDVTITMPQAPEQGAVVEFVRQDTNIFTSTAKVTAGAGDNIGDTSPYVISMRRSLILFTYWDTTWWPTMPVSGASGVSGATPSSAFAPTIMSRDGGGRAQVEDPVAAKDIVNLEYLQAHGGASNVVTGSQADVTGTSITSTVAGSGTSSAGGVEAIAIGDRASADGGNSIAIGLNSLADTDDNIAIGNSASADTGIHTVAIGNHAAASADGAVAIGDFASAGNQVVVIGTGASSDNSGIAIGNGASSGTGATTSEAIAIGNVAYATGEDAICLGVGNAEGDQAISIGTASALAKDSLAIGGNARVGSSAPGGVAIGTDNTGSGAQVLQPNEFMLGTNLHHVEIPGLLNLVPETTTPPTLRDGDVWIDVSGAWARVNGVTKQLDLSGGGGGFPPITDQTALANVNGLTAPGLYLVKPAQMVLPPASSAALGNIVGILCVYSNQVGTSTATISQTWYGRSGSQNNGGEIWTRNGFGTTPSWTEWSPAAATLTVTDYNAAIVPGDYSLMSATLTNGPGGAIRSGYLHVSTRSAAGTGTNTYLAQQWIVVDQTVPEVWVRTYAVSTWSAWKRTDSVMPAGGALGQALVKKSAADLDVQWAGGPQPLVNYSSAAILATDAVTTYPFGVTQNFMSNTQASAGGWPCGSNYCQVLTFRTQDSAGFATSQWCLSNTNSMNFAYFRSGNQNGWSSWSASMPLAGTENQILAMRSGAAAWSQGFAPTDNMFGNTNWTPPSGDTLLSDPIYPVGASYMALSTAQGGVGAWPVATTASILTMKFPGTAPDASTGWARGWQIWVRNSTTSASMYFRNAGSGGWSPWISVADDTGWKTLPLASGYQAAGSSPAPQYRVKSDVVYYRGQVVPTAGSWTATASFVTALPAEAQPTLQTNGYVMVTAATGSNSYAYRLYIAAGNPAAITCGVGTSGGAYVDLTNLTYPLN